jgi:hypothetical protein
MVDLNNAVLCLQDEVVHLMVCLRVKKRRGDLSCPAPAAFSSMSA